MFKTQGYPVVEEISS